jgi:NAD(P)-dependent dehydrogenase (short-subunit alcohol dehydrogenase family)
MSVPGHSELQGLTAFVTGGASGIGAAVASRLSALGAKVAIADISAPSPGNSDILSLRCDVTSDSAVQATLRLAHEQLGGVDILINNVGMGAQGTIESNSDREWHRVWDVNVLGIVRVTRAALPYLRQSEHASIVNTCSVAALVGLPERALYSASKGAVYSLTLAMAADHLSEGIRVNCVSPGTADTPWIGRLLERSEDPQAALAALTARQPLGRLISADEVAAAVVALASPSASSITGTNLTVDGGLQTLRVTRP